MTSDDKRHALRNFFPSARYPPCAAQSRAEAGPAWRSADRPSNCATPRRLANEAEQGCRQGCRGSSGLRGQTTDMVRAP